MRNVQKQWRAIRMGEQAIHNERLAREQELRDIALRREREENMNLSITSMMKVLNCSRERAAGILAGRIQPTKEKGNG